MTTMVATPHLSDDALAERALGPDADDREALGDLLDRHLDALLGFFLAQMRDRALAEDLVQEVCVRVIRSRARFGPPFRFRPWLWTIAHNVARRARSVTGQHRAANPSIDEGFPEEALVDNSPSPRRQAVERERHAALHGALARLDEGQRDVVLLKGIQELTGAEAAQVLGISEGTVWSRYHRALARLRDILNPEVRDL